MEKRVWLTKPPGSEPQLKTQSLEKGIYVVFDYGNWKQSKMEMTIEYNKLAERPTVFPFQKPL
jgi:CCR4-NOT transcription complex subunit 2